MTSMSIALADTILARFPDPDTIPYRRWCYVQGYVLCGFEKLWRYTGDPRYFAYIKRFVDQHDQCGELMQPGKPGVMENQLEQLPARPFAAGTGLPQ